MRDGVLGGATGADSRQSGDELSIVRVTDYASADLLVALELYNQMIPVQQRQGSAAEILEQLQSARQRRSQGLCEFEDCHFVAKLGSAVCGYMQLFFQPVEKFAFVGFLVVRASLSLGTQMAWVATRMCEEVTRRVDMDDEFGRCDRIFLELDDPGRATDEKSRRRGGRRVARFEAICKRFGKPLRFLDFDYVQARLGLPDDWPGPERPHLLGYLSKRTDSSMEGERVRNVLRLIYTGLNPEGVYHGNAEKDRQYRSYLNELCTRECARVPETVRLLPAGEVLAK